MRLRASSLGHRHLTPRCLACGRVSLDRRLEACVGCGEDFVSRPPRCYAEMEGLIDLSPPPTDAMRSWRETVTLERWLATAFTVALLVAFGLHALVVAMGD
jgi:ribosomal protein L37E